MAAGGAGGERRRATVVAGCMAAAVAALAAAPHAAAVSLGGLTSAAFTGYTFAFSPGAPTVVAYDNFTGPDGTDLDGLSIESGGLTWLAGSGAWSMVGDRARSTSAPLSSLLVDGGSSGESVEAEIARQGNPSWDTYLIVNSNATFTTALLANWWYAANGTLALYEGVDGTLTPLAVVSGLYPGGAPGSAVIRLDSSAAATVDVYLDGELVITYPLDGAEQALLKNSDQRYAGIGANLDATSTFDNFHLDG